MNDVTTNPAKAPAARTALATPSSPVGWLRGEIDRLFDEFGRPGRSIFNFAPPTAIEPLPALEMTDGNKEYSLTAELPGLTEKDVEVSVADGILTLSGEKKEETERKENGYLLSERRYGSFRRQVALPPDVNPDAIKAKFKDGVLTVSMGKDERSAARARKIAIGQ